MELSTKHRASFLAAISRVDLTEIEQAKLRSVQDTLYLGSQTGYTNSESWSLKNQPEESIAACEERRVPELHVLTGQESAAHTSVISEQKGPEDNLLSVVETQTEETSDSISNVQNELNSAYAKFVPQG